MVDSIGELNTQLQNVLSTETDKFTDEDMNTYFLFAEDDNCFTVKFKRYLPPSMGGLKAKDFLVETLGAKYEPYPKARFIIEKGREVEVSSTSEGRGTPDEHLESVGPQPVTINDSITMPIRYIVANRLKPHPKWHQIYDEHKDDLAFDESIRKFGILDPIIVDSNFVILNGHRRWKRANRFGIKQVPIQVRSFPNDVVAMVELNRYRKKTPREIYNEIKIVEEEFKPKAEEHLKISPGAGKKGLSNLTNLSEESIVVRDEAAKKVGVSSGQAYKIKEIYEKEKEIPELIEKLDKGTITIHQAHQKLRAKENPTSPKDSNEPPSQPIDTGMIFHCEVCDQDFTIIHVNRNLHRFEKAKVL